MIKKLLNAVLGKFNLPILKKNKLIEIDNQRKYYRHELQKFNFIFNNERIIDEKKTYELSKRSSSQIFQDLFVLNETKFKNNGYFIEIGAADGRYFSNTYLLEVEFGWKGILVEPAKIWHDDLLKYRSATLADECVFSTSNKEVQFLESKKPAFSTIFSNTDFDDGHLNLRQDINNKYLIKTISLNDLFRKYQIPNTIDYLSIDTEGSDYEILKTFNFAKYKISVITVEHGFTKNREKIFNLLTSQNYERVSVDYSQFDDWYVYKT